MQLLDSWERRWVTSSIKHSPHFFLFFFFPAFWGLNFAEKPELAIRGIWPSNSKSTSRPDGLACVFLREGEGDSDGVRCDIDDKPLCLALVSPWLNVRSQWKGGTNKCHQVSLTAWPLGEKIPFPSDARPFSPPQTSSPLPVCLLPTHHVQFIFT